MKNDTAFSPSKKTSRNRFFEFLNFSFIPNYLAVIIAFFASVLFIFTSMHIVFFILMVLPMGIKLFEGTREVIEVDYTVDLSDLYQ